MDEVSLNPDFLSCPAGSEPLGRHDLHVWAVPLWGDPEPLLPLLSQAERERVDRMLILDHRRRYSIAHGALRSLLAGYLAADPRALQFRLGPRGKPYLADRDDLYFNLSHSGQLALIAFGRQELGIDLEKMRHLGSLRDIAEKNFSTSEFEVLAKLADEPQLRGFYRVWNTKEAFIKALGAGLSQRLDVFDVEVTGAPRIHAFRDRDDDPASWWMQDVSPSVEYSAVVAIRGADWQLRRFRFAPA